MTASRSPPPHDSAPDDVHSVADVLDRMDAAADQHARTSIGDVLDQVGTRSFGPVLLLAGLVMMAPVVGDIPGVPTLMGLLVILATGQFLVGRDHFWLPDWILRRATSRKTLKTGVRWMRPVGRVLDRWATPRLGWLTHGAGVLVIGVASVIIAAMTPLMEVVPFSANLAGVAIAAYGLALIVGDGLIAAIALAVSTGTIVLLVWQLR